MKNIWTEIEEQKNVQSRMAEQNSNLIEMLYSGDSEELDNYIDYLADIMLNEFWNEESCSDFLMSQRHAVKNTMKAVAKKEIFEKEHPNPFNAVSIAMLDVISIMHKTLKGDLEKIVDEFAM